jgi:hypothetical protein
MCLIKIHVLGKINGIFLKRALPSTRAVCVEGGLCEPPLLKEKIIGKTENPQTPFGIQRHS